MTVTAVSTVSVTMSRLPRPTSEHRTGAWDAVLCHFDEGAAPEIRLFGAYQKAVTPRPR
jgi:hypothetical protein